MMQLSTMFITQAGSIATLHLQRTERLNAFGNQGAVDLNSAADALRQDPAIELRHPEYTGHHLQGAIGWPAADSTQRRQSRACGG